MFSWFGGSWWWWLIGIGVFVAGILGSAKTG
jgi:hypothetical protein